MRCWCGYLPGARCRLSAYGPADATAIPKPPSSLAPFKSRLQVLPFWYWLTQVVPEKRLLNGCSNNCVEFQVFFILQRERKKNLFAKYITKEKINNKNSTVASYTRNVISPSMPATFIIISA